jgi:hypothetical protein
MLWSRLRDLSTNFDQQFPHFLRETARSGLFARRNRIISLLFNNAGKLDADMKPNEPSRTALMIAMQRAAHQVLDHGSILYDPFALKIYRFSKLRRPATITNTRTRTSNITLPSPPFISRSSPTNLTIGKAFYLLCYGGLLLQVDADRGFLSGVRPQLHVA